MCLYVVRVVLLFQERQPLFLEHPKASGEMGERPLGFGTVHPSLLQLGNDLLLSGHECSAAGYVAAY
jgi:hypothetical protein